MRIAIVGPTFPYKGGGAQHTTELAFRLQAAGHEVLLESWKAQYPAFLYPGKQTIEAPEGQVFPRTRRALSWRDPIGWIRAGRRMTREADLVVLVVLSPVQVPAYLGIRYGLRGPRVVALCHNVLPHERKPYDRPLMRALLRRVDAVLAHSAQQGELARGLTGKPVGTAPLPPHLPTAPDRTVQAAAFQDPSPEQAGSDGAGHHSANADARNEPRQPYRTLLFFGIVRPYKGLDVLLHALAGAESRPSLIVAGEFWGGVDQTRNMIAELGLTDRVELRPGYVAADDIPGLFGLADALVLPYRSATASQNVWLAHEHGLPVVATRVGALPDHIRDGVDGLLVEPGDVGALTKAIERLYEPGGVARLRAGVRPVDAEPYWTRYTTQLLGL
ncbi:glycosyltransferase family 4 protein [Rhizohabitans arisaemae]|uniref:glycosyltransferase family 4 protein n=1 Tax=Rhizohabitans arisaemae TaxID=2720610 RepID=UPI0024B27FA5|nr:glycosyltransferase family 4 protein [Rhizohabitans arisaemae]